MSGDVVDCAGTAQDGEYQSGVPLPSDRFIDNEDGTVTDQLTGLVWLRRANCLGEHTFSDAFRRTGELGDGECDLRDGSVAGDWRVPNFHELFSLMDYGRSHPTLSESAPFVDVENRLHWTSTTVAGDTGRQWKISPFASGNIHAGSKTSDAWIWPVRSAG